MSHKDQITFTGRTITEWNYDFLVSLAGQYEAQSVLVFGNSLIPYAFMDANVPDITVAEYLPSYRRRSVKEFEPHSQISVVRYYNRPQVTFKEQVKEKYDLIVVASPIGGHTDQGMSRLNTTTWAINHSDVVVLHDVQRQAELLTLQHIRGNYSDLHVQVFDQNYGHRKQVAVLIRT